ncbi:MAG: hypothetical protein IKQ43_02725 [Treponema sp.]|nr:hypothetical protein [Treponema sp.]
MKSLRFIRMSKIMGIMFVCAALVSAFVSCKNPVNGPSSDSRLDGTWVSSYGENFIINTSAKTLENKYNGTTSYAGNELSVVFTHENSGYIYIKYTQNANVNGVVGKYYALSFNNLTDSSVQISGAYKAGGQSACETLDAAKQEFTIANGYFGFYSDCSK